MEKKKRNLIYSRLVSFNIFEYNEFIKLNDCEIPNCDYIFEFLMKVHVPTNYLSANLYLFATMEPNILYEITSKNYNLLQTLYSPHSISYPLVLIIIILVCFNTNKNN